MPPRIVPMGPPITNSNDLRTTVSNSARRLEVCFYIYLFNAQMNILNNMLNSIYNFRFYVIV